MQNFSPNTGAFLKQLVTILSGNAWFEEVISKLNRTEAIKLIGLLMVDDPEDATTSLDLLDKICLEHTLCFAQSSNVYCINVLHKILLFDGVNIISGF